MLALLAGASVRAQTGLVTSDPARIAAGGCQVESWYSHTAGARASLTVPVCSASDTPVTQGSGFSAIPSTLQGDWSLGASAKFADPTWQEGSTRFGLKVSTNTLGADQMQAASVLGLASMELPADVQLRLNLGPKYDVIGRTTSTQLNAAVMWPLDSRLSLTSETLTSDRSPTMQTIGTHMWLVPGRIGLDLNAGRTLGDESSSVYSMRFQWWWGDRKPLPGP